MHEVEIPVSIGQPKKAAPCEKSHCGCESTAAEAVANDIAKGTAKDAVKQTAKETAKEAAKETSKTGVSHSHSHAHSHAHSHDGKANGAGGACCASTATTGMGSGITNIPGMPMSPLEQAKARTESRANLVKYGKTLQYVTIAYTSLEATVALISGTMCCSIALIGFGLDSAIEVTSGLASLYRLRTDGQDLHRNAEMMALKITGWCFIALGAYVGYEAVIALISHEEPSRSIPGLILAAVSVFFMPWLAGAKKAVAKKLGSKALETDSKQALFCSYLSCILLVGLVLNATLHWWWADSAAALIMVPLMVREGILALQGKSCCSSGGSCG